MLNPVDQSLSHRIGSFFQRRIVGPVLHLLRTGATPRRLAWSLALGAVIGLNPLLGLSTLACLLVAFLFRLNVVAMQITNHLMYPLQIPLIFVFLRAGAWAFRTSAMPLDRDAMVAAMRSQPVQTFRLLWTWQWHALAVWAVVGLVLTPLLAILLEPLLARLLSRMQHEPSQT